MNSAVVEEAVKLSATTIVSYHPPIFRPLSKITLVDPLQKSLLRCAAEGISVYSPHSALDSVYHGINDWLAAGLLELACSSESSVQTCNLKDIPGKEGIGGLGRRVTFDKPVVFDTLVTRIKAHLELKAVEVGIPQNHSGMVQSVAICAGAGGSMLKDVEADVYWTGEMPHHEVLAAVGMGRHVVLCGHTNTERGYLPELSDWLHKELTCEGFGSQIFCSQTDAHPLRSM